MKDISNYFRENNISQILRTEGSTNFLSVGFEERCLAYPNFINQYHPGASNTFLCTYSPVENVNDYLKTKTENNKNEIKRLIPSVKFISFHEIEDIINVEELSKNIFIDISSLPRMLIFKLLINIIEKQKNISNIHFIYTFPKEYDHKKLQESHHKIDLIFERPEPLKTKKATLLIIPGFDSDYINTALSFVEYNSEPEIKLLWLLPFPGRKYDFYERLIETHYVNLSKNTYTLLPQEEIMLSYKEIKKIIEAEIEGDRNIFVLPVGCRINCIPVLLSVLEIRRINEKVNIIVPRTRWYSSSRSLKYEEPLVELIPKDILLRIRSNEDI
jgi:hypothetical protein